MSDIDINEAGIIGGIRAVGSSAAYPSGSTQNSPEDALVFNMGIGSEPRGLYIKNTTDGYDRLATIADAAGWTYVKLASDELNSTTTAIDTAMNFLPLPNTQYEIEGKFFMQSAATTTGIRPGIRWPTAGILQNVGWVMSPTSATAFVSRFWGNTTASFAAATTTPVANESIYGEVRAMIVTGASVTGNFYITLTSEVSGTQVRLMSNSFIRYRAI